MLKKRVKRLENVWNTRKTLSEGFQRKNTYINEGERCYNFPFQRRSSLVKGKENCFRNSPEKSLVPFVCHNAYIFLHSTRFLWNFFHFSIVQFAWFDVKQRTLNSKIAQNTKNWKINTQKSWIFIIKIVIIYL